MYDVIVYCIVQISTRQEVYIHPSSCLFHARPQPQYVVYSELVHTSKCYMRYVRLVIIVCMGGGGRVYTSPPPQLFNVACKRVIK